MEAAQRPHFASNSTERARAGRSSPGGPGKPPMTIHHQRNGSARSPASASVPVGAREATEVENTSLRSARGPQWGRGPQVRWPGVEEILCHRPLWWGNSAQPPAQPRVTRRADPSKADPQGSAERRGGVGLETSWAKMKDLR